MRENGGVGGYPTWSPTPDPGPSSTKTVRGPGDQSQNFHICVCNDDLGPVPETRRVVTHLSSFAPPIARMHAVRDIYLLPCADWGGYGNLLGAHHKQLCKVDIVCGKAVRGLGGFSHHCITSTPGGDKYGTRLCLTS